ncbi:MAG: selenium-dependent xanthine dehydrogenase [Acidobacteria bacterium]|nr:MAG: selenium-dependent xanthine dehydrogenase [Acidobacteriota bacterium]
MPELQFELNGLATEVSYDEGMNFLEVLRENCGVTSAKDGCAPQGFCGCCTVLVDGHPALACLTSPAKISGKVVTTLEGLPEKMRQTLAQAFVREGGVQCGFCTPGIAIRASSLLERHQATDPDRIKKALRGHLCRCTGYHRIVDAVVTAGEAWENDTNVEWGPPRRSHHFGEDIGLARDPEAEAAVRKDGVGHPSPRLKGTDQVLGKKDFVADLSLPGMLHGALVLSEYPRAVIRSIDCAPAENAPGVVRVITAADIPGERIVGLIEKDWPVLVADGETTRCVGDVLAIVVADSRYHARTAAALFEVEYDVLEPVTSPEMALAPGAPAVHPDGNLLDVCAFSRGNVDDALAASAHVIEETFTTQRIEHAFLEPESALAIPSKNGIRILSQGQGVHEDRRQIAAVLGLEEEQVEVELVTNGGAFGGKEDLLVQGHAALAAWAVGAPIRIDLTREQSLLMHPKRHPLDMHYTVGADAEGRLTAVRARIVGDTGAYASVGAKVLERSVGHACGPYRVENLDIEGKTVYTNNPPCGAMRGFGVNQTSFAIEGLLDRLAERIGIDGYDIRERNILHPGDRFAPGQIMTSSCGIETTLKAVREVYKNAPRAGIACGIKNTGIGNGMADTGRVLLRILDGGHVDALTGFTEMGQGLHTVVRQVICHETGLDPEVIDVRTVSLNEVECGMTTASRATALTTVAAQRAAQKLKKVLETSTLQDLVGQEYHGEYICDFTVAPGTPGDNPVTHLTFGYATQVVIIDDEGRIERIVAAHDVGRAINPLACAGQIEGGVHMGLGQALTENFECEDGHPTSLKMRDLGIIPADRMPPVEAIILEVPDEVGGYGSKGVGEIGLVPTAGAVASALHQRDGDWRNSLPMGESNLLPRPRKATTK